MKKLSALTIITVLLFLAACGRKPVSDTVYWSELKGFDHEAERAEARVDAGAHEEERIALSRSLIASGRALLNSGIPDNVVSRSEVDARLEDVSDLLGALEEDLGAPDILKAFHPVVHDLMEAAGMPHVHDHHHAEGHAHDHSHGHSHDHEHDHHNQHEHDHGHAPGHEH